MAVSNKGIRIVVDEVLTQSEDNSSDADSDSLDPSYFYKVLRRSSNIGSLPDTSGRNETRVLVLFTGGTIGMKKDENGVYKPIPNLMEDALRAFPTLNDKAYVEKYFADQRPPPLVLPKMEEGKRVVYTIYEYDPLLDSSNMTINDWIRVATDIKNFYQDADGFVILHGTDTMSYTASALSFMLENLGKPVIFTGSQIPIFEPRSDGQNNFLSALIIAGNYPIPEVTLFFNHKLYRGNSTNKINSQEFDAFDSPNCHPLAKVGIKIHVDWKCLHRPANIDRFRVQTTMNRNVALLRIFPSITTETVRAFLQPPLQGVVLQTYGNGNIPSNRKDLLAELKSASEAGILIINISQCTKGCVRVEYETGRILAEFGVISGLSMTPEAALTKLSYILAKDWSMETKRMMMGKNLRGELMCNVEDSFDEHSVINSLDQTLRLSVPRELIAVKEFLFPSLLCCAAKIGDIAKMELLQQYGGDVMLSNYDGRTPLHVAASEGRFEMVEFLLKHGANVHAKDRNDQTPLMEAVVKNHLGIVNLLREAGANLPKESTLIGEKLCGAAAYSDLSNLEAYLLAGISLDQPDHTGRTALQVAVMSKKTQCVQFLLRSGADVNREDFLGNSAVSIAKKIYGDDAILKLDDNNE